MPRPNLRRLAALVALALPSLVPAARAADGPAQPRELKTVRALLVIDTDSNLVESVKHDRENMRILLKEHIPEDRCKVDVLEGTRVTREEILRYYRDLRTGPDEALLFFYAGHGCIDPQLGQCLQPQMNHTPLVPRADIRKAMEEKGAGLVVLLTDCCSTRLKAKPKVNGRRTIKDVKLHPVLRCLLFQHRGTVDITAAEDGTGSFGDDQHGGVFTGALVSLLEGDLETLDRNRDGFLSWKEFFPLLARETEKRFKDFSERARANNETLDQKTQRPRFFFLADTPARQTFAVISLRNESGKAVHYRYRWAGEKEWKEARVPEKGAVCHSVALAAGRSLPDFEIEAIDEKGKGSLKPAEWAGTGPPDYPNGKEYKISSK
jgi:hypothetical protein